MKDKILMLIIGILLGAVITAGCFLIFSPKENNPNKDMNNRPEMGNFVPGEKQQRKSDGMSNSANQPADETTEQTNTTNS